mmetsp:Transcript_95308/g.153700  ORF Transcript_95308/g.153700 Transcript_95308/m.153700 type:complete len:107 (-) Transcript_95308:823-1143(-)
MKGREYVEYVGGETLVIEEPPYQAIFTAFFLLSVGTTLLTVGALICAGHIDADYWWPGEGWKQQAACFFGLGSVTFLPGSYVTYIAYFAWRGRQGFTYSSIPVHQD